MCNTCITKQCLFNDAQTKTTITVSQGIHGSHLVNKPPKMFFILSVRSPPINVIAKGLEKGEKKTYQNNYFDLASSNTTFQCEWHSYFNHYKAWLGAKKAHQKSD